MATRKNVSRAKEKVTQVLNTAKESLKLLEALERETLAKAKTFVKGSPAHLASLRKFGIASHEEVEALKLRVEKLEAAIAAHEQRHEETT